MKKLFFIMALAFLTMSCGSEKKSKERQLLESLDSMELGGPGISEDVIADIVQQIPQPLEISMLLKEVGTKYDKSILNSTDNLSKYNSNYKKALNLGIFGTDLGYTNIYKQNQDAIFYLNAIRDLANDLSIGQFFDFGTIRRLATNSRNIDSLLLITTKNFNNINAYLQDQRRSNLSILLLTGGWLEALHVACQVNKSYPGSERLVERIGEQKIILQNIMLLLSFYEETDPNIGRLSEEMKELADIFQEIEIVYTYQESTAEVVNGVLVIKDNSTSTINITDKNIKDITRVAAEIRQRIIE